jgi:predicted GNAT superfamily acetyltransferase
VRTAFEISDLHGELSARAELLAVNNASARETSHLTKERFNHLIDLAGVATFIGPGAAFLLAFEQSAGYDGGHFLWFRSRYDRFLYIDRVVVAQGSRRLGLGRALYADLFRRARELGHANIVCEVNLRPPNPTSDIFHAAHGFVEVGQATFDDGEKTVRYLLRRDDGGPI